MFGFLATLFCGSVVAIDGIKKADEKESNKKKAIRNGEKVYFDGNGSTRRSTETDEIVFHRLVNGRDEDVGIKTRKVYQCIDNNAAWEKRVEKMYKESNENLLKNNQNFYWERMPSWDYKSKKGKHLGYAQIDKANGKPIWSIQKSSDGKSYHISYGNEDRRGISTYITDNGKRRFDYRKISSDEYFEKYWLAHNMEVI